MWLVGAGVGAACALGLTSAELTLKGPRCGELTCALDQFCSPETSRCAPCIDICDPKHHNYDSGLCVQRCQDYIHELRFVSRTAGGAGAAGTTDDVRSVQLQAKAALIISSVLLALFLLTCLFKCWRYTSRNKNKFTWKYIKQKWPLSKKGRVKQYPTDLTHHNPHAEMAKSPKRELKLDVRSSDPVAPARRAQTQPQDADSAPRTISTCVSTRHPAEDTTLDYSYDNMALNVTPPPANAASQHF